MHTCVFEDYTVFFLLKYQSHYTAPFSLLLTQYIPFITEQWINKTNIYQKNSSGSRCLELYSFYFVVVNVTNLLFFVGLFFFVTLRFIKGIYILFDLYVNVSFVLFFWYGNPWNASTVIPHTCCHGRRMLSCPPLRTQQVASLLFSSAWGRISRRDTNHGADFKRPVAKEVREVNCKHTCKAPLQSDKYVSIYWCLVKWVDAN